MSRGAELLAPGLDLEALVRRIAAVVTIRDHGERPLELRLLDTVDRRLRSAGVDGFEGPAGLRIRSRADGVERPAGLDGGLRDAIAPRALLEQAALRGASRRLDVLNGEAKIVVRAELAALSVRDGERWRALAPRVWLSGLRGYERELDELRSRLCAGTGIELARAPLADEAVRALGHDPAGLNSKVTVPLAATMRSDAAAGAVLRALAAVIEGNIDGTVDDLDPEFLHDFRVSVRRSRAVQRQLKAVFPPEELARHRAEFRWLQQVTGELRDLDVQLEELGELRDRVGEAFAAALDPVGALLRERRLRAHHEVAEALRGPRTGRILRDWSGHLEELVELGLQDRPRAQAPIAELAGERIAKLYRKMVHEGRQIGAESPDEELHELRKRGKELRYMLELFGGELFPGEIVAPMVKALKSLQDVLGRHQDRHVQIEQLSALAEPLAGRPGGPRALIAVGVALRALREDAVAARSEFAERFAAFSARELRRSVRETFRP